MLRHQTVKPNLSRPVKKVVREVQNTYEVSPTHQIMSSECTDLHRGTTGPTESREGVPEEHSDRTRIPPFYFRRTGELRIRTLNMLQ